MRIKNSIAERVFPVFTSLGLSLSSSSVPRASLRTVLVRTSCTSTLIRLAFLSQRENFDCCRVLRMPCQRSHFLISMPFSPSRQGLPQTLPDASCRPARGCGSAGVLLCPKPWNGSFSCWHAAHGHSLAAGLHGSCMLQSRVMPCSHGPIDAKVIYTCASVVPHAMLHYASVSC